MGDPFQASCSLSWGVQVRIWVKYTEDWKFLSPGALSLLQSLAYTSCPIWYRLWQLLSMRPACVCSTYCCQSLDNFYKSSFEHFRLMKQSQRKHSEKGFQCHLGTSRQAKVPAWALESIVAFYIAHHFLEASPRAWWGQGTGSGWLQGKNLLGLMQTDAVTGPCPWPIGSHCARALLLSSGWKRQFCLLPATRMWSTTVSSWTCVVWLQNREIFVAFKSQCKILLHEVQWKLQKALAGCWQSWFIGK